MKFNWKHKRITAGNAEGYNKIFVGERGDIPEIPGIAKATQSAKEAIAEELGLDGITAGNFRVKTVRYR